MLWKFTYARSLEVFVLLLTYDFFLYIR